MPFDAHLIAIKRSSGEYSVYSQFDEKDGASVDQRKLRESGRLNDVSTNPGFRDLAGIFSRDEIPEFITGEATSAWLAGLPQYDVDTIMVVLEEWESGM